MTGTKRQQCSKKRMAMDGRETGEKREEKKGDEREERNYEE